MHEPRALGDVDVRHLVEDLAEARDQVGSALVVGGDDAHRVDVVALHQEAEASLDRAADARVRLVDDVDLPGVLAGQLIGDLAGAIGAPVVDDDEAIHPIDHGLDSPPQEELFVERGADKGGAHHSLADANTRRALRATAREAPFG